MKILKYELAEPKETKPNLWSSFLEIEAEIKDLKTLYYFCADYIPTSLEILEPKEMKINAEQITDSINDLLHALYKYHTTISQLTTQNQILTKKLKESH